MVGGGPPYIVYTAILTPSLKILFFFIFPVPSRYPVPTYFPRFV